MSAAASYDPITYTPPSIVRNVHSGLSIPLRGSTFLDFFSDDRDVQMLYVNRLMGLCYFFVILVIVWFLILLILRCKDPEVGCASGRAFDSNKVVYVKRGKENASEHDNDDDDDDSAPVSPIKKRASRETDSTADPYRHDPSSSSSSTSSRLYSLPSKKWRRGHKKLPTTTDSNESSSNNGRDDDYDDEDAGSHMDRSNISSDRSGIFVDENGLARRSLEEEQLLYAERVRSRAARTRSAFFFFATLILTSGITAAVNSYRPFTDAMSTSQEVVMNVFALTRRVDGIVTEVSNVSRRASVTVNGIPTRYSDLCPGIPEDTLINDVGINPIQIITSTQREFNDLKKTVDESITEVRGVLEDIDTVVETVDKTTTAIDNQLWILPLVIFCAVVVTVAALGGTLLAWCEVSSRRVEAFLSWFVLPMLVLVAIFCWTVVIALCLGSAITSDICTGGPSPGTPDATVKAVLALQDIDQDGLVFDYVVQYTSGCQGSDPTQQLLDLKVVADDTIAEINGFISSIDLIGRDELRNQCQGTGVDTLAEGLESLVGEIEIIGNTLINAQQALNCPAIHPLYQLAVHEGICTEVAAANASGFILFLLMAIGLMVLITLRASWRQTL